MSNKKFGVGIVGCGNISGVHAEAIQQSQDGELTAAFSRNSEKCERFSSEYGITAYSDYEAFLKHPGLDVVAICTPNATHLTYGEPAALSGKHVIVEKPIDITVERGRRLMDVCSRQGVKLAVIYQNRFIDTVRWMKQVIEQGELGKIFMVEASVNWFRDQEYYDSIPWRGEYESDGGGTVINQAIHTVDLLLWFLGDIDSLHAFKGTFTHENISVEDNAVAAFRFKSGVIGVFTSSTSVVPPQERKIAVYGSRGTALLEGDSFYHLKSGEDIDRKQGGAKKSGGAASPLDGFTPENHRKQYDQILDAVRNDGIPVVSGEESLKSLEFVEALYKSSGGFNGK